MYQLLVIPPAVCFSADALAVRVLGRAAVCVLVSVELAADVRRLLVAVGVEAVPLVAG